MERDTGLRRWLAFSLLLVLQSGGVGASSLPVSGRPEAFQSGPSSDPSAWTRQLGTVDPYLAPRDVRRVDVPAVWDGAVATYNMLSTPHGSQGASVFVPDAGSSVTPQLAESSAIAQDIRAAAVPLPAAVWLLVAGLIGVVGISRRRRISRVSH